MKAPPPALGNDQKSFAEFKLLFCSNRCPSAIHPRDWSRLASGDPPFNRANRSLLGTHCLGQSDGFRVRFDPCLPTMAGDVHRQFEAAPDTKFVEDIPQMVLDTCSVVPTIRLISRFVRPSQTRLAI